jgi:5-methylcytosine-specific restriction protein A
MSKPGTEWTSNETAALVDAYMWMWLNDQAGRKYVKAHLVRSLIAGPAAGRTKQSVEYKLRNVSKVFVDLGLPFVKGYVPADNASEDIKEFAHLAFGRLASRLEAASPRMWG